MKSILLLLSMACSVAFARGWDKSLDEFPKLAGEADDTARIQRAVDAIGAGVLYIPRGTYLVSSTVNVTNMCSLEMHKSAVLRAVKEMPYVVYVNPNPAWNALGRGARIDYNMYVCGGIIDADGLGMCMGIDGCQHYTLRDTSFVNGRVCGLRLNPAGKMFYEVVAENLYFKCVKPGLAGNAAVWSTGGDSHYTDCIVVDYTVGFRMGRGGSNRLTRCHVWGGPLPAVKPGEEREMLKDSICFWIDGAGDTILRDCYADTGKTGFLVDGWDTHITGSRYFNNYGFKLDDITIIDHRRGRLLVSECRFHKSNPKMRVYTGCGSVEWRNMIYAGFPATADQPGALDFEIDQECATADEWEFLPQGKPYVFASEPNEFKEPNACRGWGADVSLRKLAKRFPKAGPGKDLVVRARATKPDTKKVEITLRHDDGKVWGTQIPLTPEWQDVRIPLTELHYFKHWGNLPPLEPGDRPDARHLTNFHFCFGHFTCAASCDKAQGFEIASIRITGR